MQPCAGAPLEGDLSRELNPLRGQLLKLWQALNDKHRVFKLHAIKTAVTGLTIIGCPV